jgi:uncharacterized glyoxalase superfamily protein PhnB
MSERPTFAPYLVVGNAAAAIDFYKKAFGAEEQRSWYAMQRPEPTNSCTPISSSTAVTSC